MRMEEAVTTAGSGFLLDEVQVRVLGCLVEKAATTPGSYPLTVNALRNACNQATSREPIVAYDDRQVEAALLVLRDLRLARPVREAGARVTKFRHAFDQVVGLDSAELAALSVLMLRGPQTLGEVRTRTTRQHTFDSVAAVDATMAAMAERGLVIQLPRGPGQKEARWAHLLQADAATTLAAAEDQAMAGADGGPGAQAAAGPAGVVETYLAGAAAVVRAVSDPDVALWWDEPSVLEEQTVGSVAGHVARGGVWLVADYLAAGEPPDGPDFDSAADYFARVSDGLDDAGHRAVRARSAAIAADGPEALAARASDRLDEVTAVLRATDMQRLVSVLGGRSMRLGDYLATRIVEQAVHLDDLQRSVDGLEVGDTRRRDGPRRGGRRAGPAPASGPSCRRAGAVSSRVQRGAPSAVTAARGRVCTRSMGTCVQQFAVSLQPMPPCVGVAMYDFFPPSPRA